MFELKWVRPSGFFTSDVLAQTIPPRHLEEDDPVTLCSGSRWHYWGDAVKRTSLFVHCVQKKNTHSHFLSYLHELLMDLNKNCSEYTQGLMDSDNVKIRYSLRLMT